MMFHSQSIQGKTETQRNTFLISDTFLENLFNLSNKLESWRPGRASL